MPLCIDGEPEARLGDGAFLADAGDDIAKRPAFRHMIGNVVDGDERRARVRAEFSQKSEPARFVATVIMDAGEEGAAGGRTDEDGEAGGKIITPAPRSGGRGPCEAWWRGLLI